ncbi:MAG: hypothetical protein KDB22_20395 [Planctomycetales bacterium]|nr:hypothetical protein [Planctomycetales bacterium]
MSLFASPFAIPIVAIAGVFAWMIVSAIVSGVSAIVKHRNEVELKQMLVNQGMTADEIERIIQATGHDQSDK